MIPTSCLRAVTVVGVAAALVATGTAAAGAAPARPSVAFHTTKHHKVVGPARIQPGTVHLRNTGEHPIMVVGARGHTVTTLIADLDARGPSGFRKHFALRGLVSAHTDVYLRLAHGHYFLVDAAATDHRGEQGPHADRRRPHSQRGLAILGLGDHRQPPHVARPAARVDAAISAGRQ